MPLKKYFAVFIFTVFCITPSFATIDSCKANGYSNARILQTETGFIHAINTNSTQLQNLMHYPLRINLKSGVHIIRTPQQFSSAVKTIFVAQDIAALNNHYHKSPRDVICRSDGIGLFNGGLWLSSNYKIKTINSNIIPNSTISADLAFGQPIKAVTDQNTLINFATNYNKLNHYTKANSAALYIAKPSNDQSILTAKNNSGVIQLYKADINNTGSDKYMLTYEKQGSMGMDQITFIGYEHDHQLIPINFYKLIMQNFHKSREQWYLFFGQPFLTKKNFVYMNFTNNGITCTYFWKANKITLISNDKQQCITN